MKKSRYEAALNAVELGRACLLGYFGKINQIEEKEKAGLVSEADRESERLIQTYLAEHCPDVGFLGEESNYLESAELQREYQGARWILDPLDGTTNFVHRFPIFCISLALEVNGEIEIGIIDMPMLGETWVAERGKGTFCNGKPVHVSQTTDFSKALLATGFVVEEETESLNHQIRIFTNLVKKARGIRRAGAAAYDMACVSSGIFDLFWEKNLKPWDTAAGLLLVQEAGGVVCNFEGGRHNPFDRTMVAGNKILVQKFLEELRKL